MTKRYMKEYGNDILKRKKEMSYPKETLAEKERLIKQVIDIYKRGYITAAEAMRELTNVDLDIDIDIEGY